MMFFIQKPKNLKAIVIAQMAFLSLLLAAGAGHAHANHGHGLHQERYAHYSHRDEYHRKHRRGHDHRRDHRDQRHYHYGKKKERQIKRSLRQHYRRWHGTPYRYGGQSWRGVDCSGFVKLTYRKLFGHHLPRSSRAMFKHGKRIKKRHLKAGDLVFFRQGRDNWHVGIYMNHGQFMHASSSKGVTISSMSEPYWRRNYYGARKLL